MRSHKLRASLASASGGVSGSFSRGFYGGSSYIPYHPNTQSSNGSSYNSHMFTPSAVDASTTVTDPITWAMPWLNTQTWFMSYYRSHKQQDLVSAAELTAQSVPSGAKFNKFSNYIWGQVASTGKIPRGLRLRIFHTTDTGNHYTPISGETATILYQDTTTTEFPPLKSLADQVVTLIGSGSSNSYSTVSNMQLKTKTTFAGSASTASGQGELIEISGNGGNDSSVTKAASFTWNGTNNICVEIASTQTASSYQARSSLTFLKLREFLNAKTYKSDSDTSAYENVTTANLGSAYYAVNYDNSAIGTSITEWLNLSNWSNYPSFGNSPRSSGVLSLKLDYTT